jgi:hypothetical protein
VGWVVEVEEAVEGSDGLGFGGDGRGAADDVEVDGLSALMEESGDFDGEWAAFALPVLADEEELDRGLRVRESGGARGGYL